MKVSSNWNQNGGNLFYGQNTMNTPSNTMNTQTHISFLAIPIIIYGLISVYSKYVSEKTGLKEYVIFIYISFCLLLFGYSEYTRSILNNESSIFYIGLYLMITSIIALSYFLYKVITYEKDEPTKTISE